LFDFQTLVREKKSQVFLIGLREKWGWVGNLGMGLARVIPVLDRGLSVYIDIGLY
jgi:hypothetical protein